MAMKNKLQYLWFITIPALVGMTITRQPEFREAYFSLRHQDHRLTGHQIDQLVVTDVIECCRACIMMDRCQSFNFENNASNNSYRICQLNDVTAGSDGSGDLMTSRGFSYYEEPQTLKNLRCHDKLCQNGGTCVESARKFSATCKCAEFYRGRYCQDIVAKDCQDILTMGGTSDGIYSIDPDDKGAIRVLCDQTSDGGGWMIIQHRHSPFNTSFVQNWISYKLGFGNLTQEFWLGNDAIHRITSTKARQLVVVLRGGQNTAQAKYSNFTVSVDGYRIEYGLEYLVSDGGNAIGSQTGSSFSTYDRDNDGNAYENCAGDNQSGWWYTRSCGHADLNRKGNPLWDTWRAKITSCTMKLR